MASKLSLLALGGFAVVLASKKKRRRRSDSSEAEVDEVVEEGWDDESGGVLEEDDLFEEIGEHEDLPPEGGGHLTPAQVILALEHPDKKAHLGGLYQIRLGDNLVMVAREALYGTREQLVDPHKRAAVLELAALIDCSRWNQMLYGADPSILNHQHPAIESGWSQVGISFNPIYTDNRTRMLAGKPPSGAAGNKFAFIYIPRINLDLLDMDGTVTTQGMNYPDRESGMGHNMIDPPIEILNLDTVDVVERDSYGCAIPEGA